MEQNILYNEAKNFFQVFEPKGEIISVVKVPGSIQLLGEVTNFNQSKVISVNIGKSAIIMAQKRKEGDRIIHFYSRKYDEKIKMTLNDPQSKEEHGWANFIASTLFMLEGNSKKVFGMNVYIDNQIPDLFDANSIESLEIGVLYLASKFSDWQLKGAEMAQICAEGEKRFLGNEKSYVKYIPAIFGKKAAITLFDSGSNTEENINLDMKNYIFLTLSSGVKKKHIEEKKNNILKEVEEAIMIMQKSGANFSKLNEITMEQFDEYRNKLSVQQRKRCAYFISENERVESARQFLIKNDINGFAQIINDSQKNIKNRLEILEEENEILLDIIQDIPEIKAARLVNMGIDGTVFILVEKNKKSEVESRVKKTFLARTGLELYSETFGLDNQIEEFQINVNEFKK
jgi:galactokinase